MDETEFWDLAWPEFVALMEGWDKRNRRENYRAGLAASVIINLFASSKRQRIEPLDFFEPRKTTRQTPEEMLRRIEQFNMAMGGKDLRASKSRAQK